MPFYLIISVLLQNIFYSVLISVLKSENCLSNCVWSSRKVIKFVKSTANFSIILPHVAKREFGNQQRQRQKLKITYIILCTRAKAHNSTCTSVVEVSIFLLPAFAWQYFANSYKTLYTTPNVLTASVVYKSWN